MAGIFYGVYAILFSIILQDRINSLGEASVEKVKYLSKSVNYIIGFITTKCFNCSKYWLVYSVYSEFPLPDVSKWSAASIFSKTIMKKPWYPARSWKLLKSVFIIGNDHYFSHWFFFRFTNTLSLLTWFPKSSKWFCANDRNEASISSFYSVSSRILRKDVPTALGGSYKIQSRHPNIPWEKFNLERRYKLSSETYKGVHETKWNHFEFSCTNFTN